MKAKNALLALVVVCVAGFLSLSEPFGAEPAKEAGQSTYLSAEKLQESEAKAQLTEPHFGYVGDIGTFVASTKNAQGIEAHADFVVHQYPHEDKINLGCTKLKYEGPKHLGNVDGWVFTTEWDGKTYPSKVFLSAQKVYFGGGRQAYIAADYRTETGWAWKMVPLRRMELAAKSGAAANR